MQPLEYTNLFILFEALFMTWNIMLGIALTIFALGAVVFLTLWNRRIIEQIHAHRPGSLRHIQKDILNGNNSRNKS